MHSLQQLQATEGGATAEERERERVGGSTDPRSVVIERGGGGGGRGQAEGGDGERDVGASSLREDRARGGRSRRRKLSRVAGSVCVGTEKILSAGFGEVEN